MPCRAVYAFASPFPLEAAFGVALGIGVLTDEEVQRLVGDRLLWREEVLDKAREVEHFGSSLQDWPCPKHPRGCLAARSADSARA